MRVSSLNNDRIFIFVWTICAFGTYPSKHVSHVQVFLVWKSSVLQKKVLSFHVDGTPDSSVIHIPVKENQYSMLGRLYHAKP